MNKPKVHWTEEEIEEGAELVRSALDVAIKRFNESADAKTLLWPRKQKPETPADRHAASERSLTYRLAYYLECELRTKGLVTDNSRIVVDVEYNRHLGDKKTLAGDEQERIRKIVKDARGTDLEPEDDGFCVFSIAPDIIVHERGQDANLVVIEVKKRSNPESEKYDQLKLELFTRTKTQGRGFGYRRGVWVMAEDKCTKLEDRKLRVEWECRNEA